MSSNVRADALTAHLVDTLTAALPSKWKVRDAEAKAVKALGIVLFYEQLDFHSQFNGDRLSYGYVYVDYVLTLTSPQTDITKATKAVTEALLELLPALDQMPELFWSDAEKVRLETGETAYRLPVTFISSYLPE
jgi:hypothetical protein